MQRKRQDAWMMHDKEDMQKEQHVPERFPSKGATKDKCKKCKQWINQAEQRTSSTGPAQEKSPPNVVAAGIIYSIHGSRTALNSNSTYCSEGHHKLLLDQFDGLIRDYSKSLIR